MGAVIAPEEGVGTPIAAAEDFVQWPPGAADGALARAAAAGASVTPATPDAAALGLEGVGAKACGKRWLTRRQWWDVYNDYTVVVGAGFLTLPPDLFDQFAVGEGEDARADAAVVAMALLLLSTLELDSVLQRCGAVLCLAHGGNVAEALMEPGVAFDGAQLRQLFRLFARTAHVLRATSSQPPERTIKRMVEQFYTEAHLKQGSPVGPQHIVEYMRAEKKVSDTLSAIKDAKRAAARATAKLAKVSLVTGDGAGGAGGTGGMGGPVSHAERISAMNANYVAAKKVIEDIDSSEHKLGLADLRSMREEFIAVAGSEAGELSRTQFADLMHRKFPFLAEGDAVQALFDSFDTDHSNTIDYREFAVGLSKRMSGSTSDKLRVVFDAFKDASDSSVDVGELLEVVRRGNEEMADLAEFTEDVISTLDTNGTGVISRAAFRTALKDQPILDDCFTKATNTDGIDGVRVAYLDLSDTHRIPFEQVRTVWNTHLDGGWGELADMSLTVFRTFCTDSFGCQQPMMDVLNRLFDAMNKDGGDQLPVETLVHGLAQIVEADEDDRIELFFDLYDEDGNGELDMNEIRSIVLSSQSDANKSARTALRLLKELDRISDGRVDLDTFISHASKNPALMKCFKTILGVDTDHDPSQRGFKTGKIRTMLLNGGHGPRASRASARDTHVPGKDAEEGLRRLRRQSLRTASEIVTNLQLDLHDDGDGGSATDEAGSDVDTPRTKATKADAVASASAVRAAARTYGDMLNRKMSTRIDDLRKEVKSQRRDSHKRLLEQNQARKGFERSMAESRRGSGKSTSATGLLSRRSNSMKNLHLDTAIAGSKLPQVSPLGTKSDPAVPIVLSPGSQMRAKYGSVATAKAKGLKAKTPGSLGRSSSARNLYSRGSIVGSGDESSDSESPRMPRRPRTGSRLAPASGASPRGTPRTDRTGHAPQSSPVTAELTPRGRKNTAVPSL